MSTEQDTHPLPWQQLLPQQQLQQQPEPVDLTTYREPDFPPERGEQEEHPTPPLRENAVVEGDDAPEEEIEQQADDATIEETVEIPIRNEFGDELTQAVSIRGHKDAVEKFKAERMMHASFTQKTTELARQRDGIADAVRQAQDQARTQYVQHIETLRNTVFSTIEPELQKVDWQKLYQDDPQEYLRLDAKQKHLRHQLETLDAEQRRAAETQAREDYGRLQERIQQSRTEVMSRDPTWSDQKYSQILSTVAQKYQFSLEEVAQVIDPRIIMLMSDVTKYHQGTDQRALARKKIAVTPKAIPSGPAAQPRATDESVLQKRFKRTGNIEDGAKLLEARLRRR